MLKRNGWSCLRAKRRFSNLQAERNEPLTVLADYEKPFGNTVTVRVNYNWFPEMYLVGPFTLTSTSTAQMVY